MGLSGAPLGDRVAVCFYNNNNRFGVVPSWPGPGPGPGGVCPAPRGSVLLNNNPLLSAFVDAALSRDSAEHPA